MPRSSPLLVLAAALLYAGPLAAQARVHGTVRDSLLGTPLPLVEVLVEGMNLSTRTDGEGRYALSIPLGFHTIVFRRIGYHPLTRQLRLSTADSVRLDLAMLDQAQRLAPVEVDAPAPPRTWPPGLDNRMKDGFGQFVTDSTLRRFEHTSMSNMLQARVSGVRFKRIGGRNVAIAARGGRAAVGAMRQDCYLQVWLDGMLLWDPGDFMRDPNDPSRFQGNPPPDFDRFSIVSLEAVEVYTVAQVPAQYRGRSAGCGVILLWSRTQRN